GDAAAAAAWPAIAAALPIILLLRLTWAALEPVGSGLYICPTKTGILHDGAGDKEKGQGPGGSRQDAGCARRRRAAADRSSGGARAVGPVAQRGWQNRGRQGAQASA